MRVLDVVPVLVNRGIGESIICAQIDDSDGQFIQLPANVHGVTVRQRDENKIAVRANFFNVAQTFQFHIVNSAEMRVEFGNSLAGVALRRDMRNVNLRVPVQNRQKFRARVARRANYADF